MSRALHYHISGQTNFLDIQVTFHPTRIGTTVFHLPIWRPGRYQAQYFAKNIAEVTASHGQIRKLDVSSWTLLITDLAPVVLSYRYFADQPDAGGSVSTEELCYINFINCLIFPHRGENRPCVVEIRVPSLAAPDTLPAPDKLPAPDTLPGWSATHSKSGDYAFSFRSKNYRTLVDTPFIASKSLFSKIWYVDKIKFQAIGVGPTHHFSERLLEAYRKIARYQVGYMRGFPTKTYQFLHWICPKPFYHGVEHTSSTMMVLGPEDRDAYEDLIGLASHELFHVWNVATIRPKQLLPYNYTATTIFDTGWVVEGITTYLGDWFLAAAGVISAEAYVHVLQGNLALHFDRDGEAKQSLVESSVDLWLDGYGQALPGKRVSIYFKGALVALALDLIIRRKYQHQKSLREVMLAMNESFGNLKKGYTREDFYAVAEAVYAGDLHDFWAKWVESAAPLMTDIQLLLADVGLHYANGLLEIRDKDKLSPLFSVSL